MSIPNYEELLEQNKEWVSKKLIESPEYFEKLSKNQQPKYLFIGCSDSRAPLTLITKMQPGEVFVHRNIANIVNLADMNSQTVIEYAVDFLKVEHIIILGHYHCGGVRAAVEWNNKGMIDNWVSSIHDLYFSNIKELEQYNNKEEMLDRLSELNVIEQVKNLIKSPCMQRAYSQETAPQVHGWIFNIYTGFIKEMELPIQLWKTMRIMP